jgi:hypothetical protein
LSGPTAHTVRGLMDEDGTKLEQLLGGREKKREEFENILL